MMTDLNLRRFRFSRLRTRASSAYLLIVLSLAILSPQAALASDPSDGTVPSAGSSAILWNKVDVSSQNLFYGPGGKDHEPHGKMTFSEEDKTGSNPKFDVVDQDGTKWKVKMAVEARPETAASRLLWAIGFFSNEDYFVHELKVDGVPAQLLRGREKIDRDGTMRDVRLKRYLDDQKKIGSWHWKKNPFAGSREFDGLRVMMALLNNWDLKDVNNGILEIKSKTSPHQIYLVSDLGATFGTTGRSLTQAKSKGNLEEYRRSKFIRKVTDEHVDFNVPTRPSLIFVFGVPTYISRVRMGWIGKHIPRTHAKWVGEELSKLSHEQIRDAFRSAGYTPEEVEGFAQVVENRIGELKKL